MPDRFVVLEIGGDYVRGKSYDDLDVEHVQILRLSKPVGRAGSDVVQSDHPS